MSVPVALLIGDTEYTDCISAEGKTQPTSLLVAQLVEAAEYTDCITA